MSIREKLSEIVGSGNFSDDPTVLSKYSADSSLTPAGAPSYVVKPKDAQEVQKILQFANEQSIPVVPVSSAVHFHGATIPRQGGIVLDLARMKKVLEIDEDNRRVRIEAGVLWQQLTEELAKKGMRMIMPLLPPANRSVLTDYLEREVPTNTVYDYGEPMQSLEVVWPTGEIFRMGSASVNGYPDSASKGANPSGPGLDFYRFVQGAQGTMGVVTWVNLKIESIPKIDKIYFAAVDDLAYAQEFLYRILPRRIGQECLLLNNVELAAIIAEDCRKSWKKTGEESGNSLEKFIELLWGPLTGAGFAYTMDRRGERTQFRVTRCPLAELARTMGEEKWLYHLACLTDEPSVTGFNPGIAFERTQTLMQGDPVCDHCYTVKG